MELKIRDIMRTSRSNLTNQELYFNNLDSSRCNMENESLLRGYKPPDQAQYLKEDQESTCSDNSEDHTKQNGKHLNYFARESCALDHVYITIEKINDAQKKEE